MVRYFTGMLCIIIFYAIEMVSFASSTSILRARDPLVLKLRSGFTVYYRKSIMTSIFYLMNSHSLQKLDQASKTLLLFPNELLREWLYLLHTFPNKQGKAGEATDPFYRVRTLTLAEIMV